MKSLIEFSKEKRILKQKLTISDLDIKVLVISPKKNIELVTKELAKVYYGKLTVYQNEIGTFDAVAL